MSQILSTNFTINLLTSTTPNSTISDFFGGEKTYALDLNTPLSHYALARMLLVEYKANPNIVSMLGSTTPLHIAVERGHRQMSALLLSFGANVNAKDKQGNSPLHYCRNNLILRLLMKFDCDPLYVNRKMQTASQYYKEVTLPEDMDPDLYGEFIRREEWKRRVEIFLIAFSPCSLYDRNCVPKSVQKVEYY